MGIKQRACEAGHYVSFPELTALVMANQYLKKGRKYDARRILLSYLKRHPATPKISATLSAIA